MPLSSLNGLMGQNGLAQVKTISDWHVQVIIIQQSGDDFGVFLCFITLKLINKNS
jgi:hypothetical protein